MSVGLYRDVHVPAAITRGLLLRGVDVLTAQLDGTTRLADPDLSFVIPDHHLSPEIAVSHRRTSCHGCVGLLLPRSGSSAILRD